jgi:hypothetical protein
VSYHAFEKRHDFSFIETGEGPQATYGGPEFIPRNVQENVKIHPIPTAFQNICLHNMVKERTLIQLLPFCDRQDWEAIRGIAKRAVRVSVILGKGKGDIGKGCGDKVHELIVFEHIDQICWWIPDFLKAREHRQSGSHKTNLQQFECLVHHERIFLYVIALLKKEDGVHPSDQRQKFG